MKNILIVVSLFIFSLQSHGENKKQILDKETQKQLENVFIANENLHQAFFDYKNQKTKITGLAQKLNQSMEMVSDPDIKKKLIFSQTKLKEITTEATKNDNDQRYHLVSMALIHLLKKYVVGGDYQGYTCPMVKKKWVQKAAKAQNPYAVDMPDCGSKE